MRSWQALASLVAPLPHSDSYALKSSVSVRLLSRSKLTANSRVFWGLVPDRTPKV